MIPISPQAEQCLPGLPMDALYDVLGVLEEYRAPTHVVSVVKPDRYDRARVAPFVITVADVVRALRTIEYCGRAVEAWPQGTEATYATFVSRVPDRIYTLLKRRGVVNFNQGSRKWEVDPAAIHKEWAEQLWATGKLTPGCGP